jgi:hypothetical protein
MTPIFARKGLRESWEEYRARLSGPFAARLVAAGPYRNVVASLRVLWRQEGWRLLGWGGPGTGPCATSNGVTLDESPAEGEARPDPS